MGQLYEVWQRLRRSLACPLPPAFWPAFSLAFCEPRYATSRATHSCAYGVSSRFCHPPTPPVVCRVKYPFVRPWCHYAPCPSTLLPPYPFHFYYFFTYTCTVYRSAYVSVPPLRTLSTPQSTYLIVFAPLGHPLGTQPSPAQPARA